MLNMQNKDKFEEKQREKYINNLQGQIENEAVQNRI